jgi:hypothetical protein
MPSVASVLLAWDLAPEPFSGPELPGGLGNLLSGMVTNCPTFLMMALGVVLALATWKRHAGVSALLLGGVSLHGLMVVVTIVLGLLVPTLVDSGTLPPDGYSTALRGITCFGSLGHALANLLLVVAALRGRPATP